MLWVSGEQQRDSVIHIHVSILPSHRGCHITLSRVPCAIPWVLVGYLFEIQQCVHVHPKLPNYPFLPLILTPATISSFSKSVSLKVPPKKSISLELLPIDLHCFSSIHHWPHTNPPIPSSPNKDHMLPQICQKKKTNKPFPSNQSFLLQIKHQFLQPFLGSHNLETSHLLDEIRSSPLLKPSVAPQGLSQLKFFSLAFKTLQCMSNLILFFLFCYFYINSPIQQTHLIIFPGIPYVFPASTPICKMPLPGTPSLFPLHQGLSLPGQRSSLLVLNAVCCSRKEGWY